MWHLLGREREDQMANNDAAQPMIDWVCTAPPAEVAAELMAAFGPDGPQRRGSGEGPSPAPIELAKWLFRGHPKPSFTS